MSNKNLSERPPSFKKNIFQESSFQSEEDIETIWKNLDHLKSKACVTFSTATLPGLVQAYLKAETFPHVLPNTDALKEYLISPYTKAWAIFMLEGGASALNALECLNTEDYASARRIIKALALKLFRAAEGQKEI